MKRSLIASRCGNGVVRSVVTQVDRSFSSSSSSFSSSSSLSPVCSHVLRDFNNSVSWSRCSSLLSHQWSRRRGRSSSPAFTLERSFVSTIPKQAPSVNSSYASAHQLSLSSPEEFWREAARDISWSKPFRGPALEIKRDSNNNVIEHTWFPNEFINTCYNALDYHVDNGRADQVAIAYDSPVTNTKRKITYKQLLDQVSKFAGALQAKGVTKGDRVIIYMPMIPEAVVAMLACARLGAIHSVVFGGFAPNELSKRIIDAKPKVIISASCGIEIKKVVPYKPMLDEAIQLSGHTPQTCVIFQREQVQASLTNGRDIEWNEFVKKHGKDTQPVPVKSTDPLYILYTSGTTGTPKGVVRDNGGHAVALKYMMRYMEGVKPGDVFWAASDIGWVVGHTFIVYGPLLLGCTSVLYEGKPVATPDAGAFWRVISENGVNALYTAPTALRAIKKEDPELKLRNNYSLTSLRRIFLAGERADPDSLSWASSKIGVPVLDNWWQTETGWPIVGNPVGFKDHQHLPVKPGSACVPCPGYDVQVLDDNGKLVQKGSEGNLVIRNPLPPGCLPTLWQNPERFRKSYMERFPGYYDTADAGFVDKDGYVWILSRTDDIINVAGHRMSGGTLEEVLSAHPAVAEVAVIAVPDSLKGHVPVGIVVLKAGHSIAEADLEKECIANVRHKVGPVAALKRVIVVNRLPKTRSGKILRNIMRAIAEGKPYTAPPTIDDPAVPEEIAAIMKKHNLAP